MWMMTAAHISTSICHWRRNVLLALHCGRSTWPPNRYLLMGRVIHQHRPCPCRGSSHRPYRLPKNLEQRQQRLTLPFETNPFATMLITITHVGCCEYRHPDAFLLLQQSLITYAQRRASRTCWTNDRFALCSTSSTISAKNAPTRKQHKQIRVQECRKCPALVPRTRLHSDTKLILDGPAGRPWAGPKKGTPAGMYKVQRGYFELRARTGSTSLSISKPQGPV